MLSLRGAHLSFTAVEQAPAKGASSCTLHDERDGFHSALLRAKKTRPIRSDGARAIDVVEALSEEVAEAGADVDRVKLGRQSGEGAGEDGGEGGSQLTVDEEVAVGAPAAAHLHTCLEAAQLAGEVVGRLLVGREVDPLTDG